MKLIDGDIAVMTREENWDAYLDYLNGFNPNGDVSLSVLEFLDSTGRDYNLLPLEEVLNNKELILGYNQVGYICLNESCGNLIQI